VSQKVLILSTDEVFQGPLAVAILRRVAGGRYEVGMPGHPHAGTPRCAIRIFLC
jgi:hypothetical protein